MRRIRGSTIYQLAIVFDEDENTITSDRTTSSYGEGRRESLVFRPIGGDEFEIIVRQLDGWGIEVGRSQLSHGTYLAVLAHFTAVLAGDLELHLAFLGTRSHCLERARRPPPE